MSFSTNPSSRYSLTELPAGEIKENSSQASLQLSLWNDIHSFLFNPKRRQLDLLERRQVLFTPNFGLNSVKDESFINSFVRVPTHVKTPLVRVNDIGVSDRSTLISSISTSQHASQKR